MSRGRNPTPLEEILVEHSTCSRGSLKKRPYASGLKQRAFAGSITSGLTRGYGVSDNAVRKWMRW